MTETTTAKDGKGKRAGGRRAGGRPSKPLAERRTERISFGVTKAQKAAFLVNAGLSGQTSNDYARDVLCQTPDRGLIVQRACGSFELIDILSRIGADLARLRFIAEETDSIPPGLDDVIRRLDGKLDHLIVGAGIADELVQHRAALLEIAAKLEAQKAMTAKARGMIATFDLVVTKVLSA